jgi:hypothetical protein
LTALDQLTQVGRLDRIQLERSARECLTDWQGLLAGQPVQARQMLRKLLEGRLVFTPTDDGTTVAFRGTGVLDPVLSGIVDAGGLPKASGSRWSHHRSDAGLRIIGPSARRLVAKVCCHSGVTRSVAELRGAGFPDLVSAAGLKVRGGSDAGAWYTRTDTGARSPGRTTGCRCSAACSRSTSWSVSAVPACAES